MAIVETKYDGGPAFPTDGKSFEGMALPAVHSGMTLRDYFAGQAMVGFLAHGDLVGMEAMKGRKHAVSVLQTACYEIADGMLIGRMK